MRIGFLIGTEWVWFWRGNAFICLKRAFWIGIIAIYTKLLANPIHRIIQAYIFVDLVSYLVRFSVFQPISTFFSTFEFFFIFFKFVYRFFDITWSFCSISLFSTHFNLSGVTPNRNQLADFCLPPKAVVWLFLVSSTPFLNFSILCRSMLIVSPAFDSNNHHLTL